MNNRSRQEPQSNPQHPLLKIDKRNTAGFTLVELLVVIAVLALLAGLALPALLQSSEASNRGKCFANMRQISSAYLLMVADNNNILIPATDPVTKITWYNQIAPYLGFTTASSSSDWRNLCCPSALAGLAKVGITTTTTTSSRSTYGLNDAINPAGSFSRMVNLSAPSATLLLGDTLIGDPTKKTDWTTSGIKNSNIYAWHKGKYAICYFDGHAEFVDQAFKESKKGTTFYSGL